MKVIEIDSLIQYANNQKNKTIDANDIAQFPNVIDIVRCKDCIYSKPAYVLAETDVCLFEQIPALRCSISDIIMWEDEFCSCGERNKANETN